MPHDEAPARHAGRVHEERADLPPHLANRQAVDPRVVRRPGEAGGGIRIPVPHVGQVDIHDAVEEAQGLARLIPARVVHDREREPLRGRQRERLEDLGEEVRRGDEVEVVAAPPLERQEYAGERIRLDRGPGAPLAEFVVLAVGASERASAEKDRARPGRSGERRLLPEVRGGAEDPRGRPFPAEPRLAPVAAGAACAGA